MHSHQAVKIVGKTVPGTGATEQLLADLPSEQRDVVRAEIESAEKEAAEDGVERMKDVADRETEKWANEVGLVGLKGRQQIERAREADIEHVRKKMKTIESQELKMVHKMGHDVKMAELQAESTVLKDAEAMAKSESLNAVSQALAPRISSLSRAHVQVLDTRIRTLAAAKGAEDSAAELVAVAGQADQISQDLTASFSNPKAYNPELVAEEAIHAVGNSLDMSRHEKKLSGMDVGTAKKEEERGEARVIEAAKLATRADMLLHSLQQQDAKIQGLESQMAQLRAVGLDKEVHTAMS